MKFLRASRLASTAVLLGAFSISYPAWAPPGGNGGGKKGGEGGGESSIRLCAYVASSSGQYINQDAGGEYCDGEDGEMLVAEGLKFSTVTRNPNERRVAVNFQASNCPTRRDGFDLVMPTTGFLMDAFFANAQSTEFEGCEPGDPFDPAFNPDNLSCLESNGVQLPVREMLLDETRYTSMRVNLTEPGVGLKKSDFSLVLTFAENLGPNVCAEGDALPAAIRCTAEDADGACSAWDFKAFRACAFDYNSSRGGNWQWAAGACPVTTEISFTAKP